MRPLYWAFYVSIPVYGGGTGAIGIYDPNYSADVGYNSSSNDASLATNQSIITVTGLLKKQLQDNLSFAYGVSYASVSGSISGDTYTASGTSFQIGLEYALTKNLSLKSYYSPLSLTTTTFLGSTVNSTRIGQDIVLGVGYLF